ncbi:hypothetical protein N0A02_32665 [Paraburkholderia acidicola]|uniref:Uncharacterized protein n=1 Tax=Paraburkholderia acidicola TaxID=1912599 RepID=A0ABV1LXZ2_9BURK
MRTQVFVIQRRSLPVFSNHAAGFRGMRYRRVHKTCSCVSSRCLKTIKRHAKRRLHKPDEKLQQNSFIATLLFGVLIGFIAVQAAQAGKSRSLPFNLPAILIPAAFGL